MADADQDAVAQADDTFSSLIAPDIEMQEAAHKTSRATKDFKPTLIRRKPSSDTDIEWVFKHVFDKKEYRGQQKQIMKAALSGLDIVVVAPTGMGKSLCYQVPAMADRHGITIVISPLVSLIEDQMRQLVAKKAPAAMLTSSTAEDDRKRIFKDLYAGHPKTRLLYVTPERIADPKFRKVLKVPYEQQELARFVIDEMHCIETWGKTFRPSYSQLGVLRKEFREVPISALTASITEEGVENIIKDLGLDRNFLFRAWHSFNRANIFYQVKTLKPNEDRIDDIARFIKKRQNESKQPVVSGIIYCRKRDRCEYVAEELKKKGIRAAPYHRGMNDKVLLNIQRGWMDNTQLHEKDQNQAKGDSYVACIVATIALGEAEMSHTAIASICLRHGHRPCNFEEYIGCWPETHTEPPRDTIKRLDEHQKAARALLYYSASEAKQSLNRSKSTSDLASETGQMPLSKISAKKFVEFCEEAEKCRHVAICRFFGEEVTEDDAAKLCNRFCDNCKRPGTNPNQMARGESDSGSDKGKRKATEEELKEMFADDAQIEDAADIEMEDATPRPSHLRSITPDIQRQTGLSPPLSPDSRNKGKRKHTSSPFKPPSQVKPRIVVQDSDEDEDLPDIVIPKRRKNASPSPSPSDVSYHIEPVKYGKAIDMDLRKSIARQIFMKLSRLVAISTSDSLEDDDALHLILGHNDPRDERHQIVADASSELESDLFWTSVSESGYRGRLGRLESTMQSRDKTSPVWAALRRVCSRQG